MRAGAYVRTHPLQAEQDEKLNHCAVGLPGQWGKDVSNSAASPGGNIRSRSPIMSRSRPLSK
jgi:hypothetical protein